jgi:hypothetical protein
MRVARKVNLQKCIGGRCLAAFAPVSCVAQKMINLRKTLQIESVDDHPMDVWLFAMKSRNEHLANLQLTHAEISFTEKTACTSLVG